MAKAYNEFGFNEDIELMNLTYQMQCGNFTNYEDESQNDNFSLGFLNTQDGYNN